MAFSGNGKTRRSEGARRDVGRRFSTMISQSMQKKAQYGRGDRMTLPPLLPMEMFKREYISHPKKGVCKQNAKIPETLEIGVFLNQQNLGGKSRKKEEGSPAKKSQKKRFCLLISRASPRLLSNQKTAREGVRA